MGYDVEQICYVSTESNLSISKKIKKSLKTNGLYYTLKILFNLSTNRIKVFFNKFISENEKVNIRNKAMQNFREKHIPHSKIIYYKDTIHNCKDYDTYISGSDQVWRLYNKEIDKGYWLSFVSDASKRISYAASISMNNIPKKNYKEIIDTLSKYSAISVREEEGKKLLENIIKNQKNIEQTLDPTLLFTANEWSSFCAENPYKNEDYIFAYFLGNKNEDRKSVKSFAKKNNLKIITIPYLLGQYRKCDKNFGDIRLFNVDPFFFLSLIKDAKYVMTDSFHGTVYSFLFHKEFYLYKRSSDKDIKSMNSRIYSLLNLFNCKDRIVSPLNEITNETATPIDFKYIDEVLEAQRKKSKNFLSEALNN